MKKTVFILLFVTALISCKKDVKQEENTTNNSEITEKQDDGLTVLKGEFVYFADAAVLQTHEEVYAVIVDDMMHEMNKKLEHYKKEPTDMVPVAIKGKISPKPEGVEGWPFRVEIKEIIEIYEPKPEDNTVIKLSN